MTGFKEYHGLHGEIIPVEAASIGTRSRFPVAEYADEIASDTEREALGYFALKSDYGSVQAFAASQLRRHALGLETKATPRRFGR